MRRIAAHFSVWCAILCSALIVFATLTACSSPKPQATPPPQPASAPPNPQPSAQTNPTPPSTASAQPQTNPSAPVAHANIPPEQLDALVAPVALYPDPLLAQVLAASTYPLEIIQLQQWLKKNPGLKDKALADAVSKQPWDASIQSMAAMPDLVDRLSNDVQWTTDLGNAFLAQQKDVMDAVQRMRQKALDKGTLQSNEQQKVEKQTVENGQTVVVIEQANPGRGLRSTRLSVSADLLPLLPAGRRVYHFHLWLRHGRMDERRLGLWVRLGRQHRLHQSQQQLHRRRRWRRWSRWSRWGWRRGRSWRRGWSWRRGRCGRRGWSWRRGRRGRRGRPRCLTAQGWRRRWTFGLATPARAPRRRALRGSGNGGSIRRKRPWRLLRQSPGKRAAAGRTAGWQCWCKWRCGQPRQREQSREREQPRQRGHIQPWFRWHRWRRRSSREPRSFR
jgi:hypothetical protein